MPLSAGHMRDVLGDRDAMTPSEQTQETQKEGTLLISYPTQ